MRQELAQNLVEFLAQVLVEFMELQDYLLAQRLVEEVPVQAEDEGTAEPLPQALGGKGRGPASRRPRLRTCTWIRSVLVLHKFLGRQHLGSRRLHLILTHESKKSLIIIIHHHHRYSS